MAERLRKLGLGIGLGAAALMALGCSASEESTTTTRGLGLSAAPCVVGQVCTLTYELPSGINSEEIALSADRALWMSDRSSVRLADGRLGPVANTGTGTTDIGADARVAGVSARGGVEVRSRAQAGVVRGQPVNVQASGQVSSILPAASAPATISVDVTFPTASLGAKNLEPSQQLSISPGRYDSWSVKRNAKLHLNPGVYYVDHIGIESMGQLEIDARAGTVVVFVRGTLTHRGKLSYQGTSSDALFAVLGGGQVLLEGEFDATVVAPASDLTIGPNDNQTALVYDGVYFGGSVTVRPPTTVRRQPLTGTGDAIGSVVAKYSGDPNAKLPRDLPSPTGKTPNEYLTDANDLIEQLVETGYRGKPVVIEEHPDYKGTEPALDDSIKSKLPNPPRAPEPGGATGKCTTGSCVDSLVSTAVPQVQADYPETTEDYVAPAEPKPSFCPLGEGTEFPAIDTSNQEAVFEDFYQEYGDPKPTQIPDFDGWFGGRASGAFGLETQDNGKGLYAEVHGDFGAGFAVFAHPLDLVLFEADGHVYSANSRDEEQLEGSAHVDVLGETKYSWEYGESLEPFRGDLCVDCRKDDLFGADGIVIPVAGIISISFNAGLEAALPAGLDLAPTGPAFTFSPMFRVFAIVRAIAGEGIRVFVEGEIDVLRVDVPVRAQAKFVIDTSPSVCAAKIQPNVDLKLRLSTLNGKVYLVGEVWAVVEYVELFRWKLFTWDGLHYDLPVEDFTDGLPSLEIPLDKEQCVLDSNGCKTAPAASIPAGELTPENIVSTITVPPSTWFKPNAAQCAGQYLLEIPPEKLTGGSLNIDAVWDDSKTVSNASACEHQRAIVNIFGKPKGGGDWSLVDSRKFTAEFKSGSSTCAPVVYDYGPGEGGGMPNDSRKIWLTPTKYERVRVAVVAAQSCEPLDLRLVLTEDF